MREHDPLYADKEWAQLTLLQKAEVSGFCDTGHVEKSDSGRGAFVGWVASGCHVYELTHSIAALLAATRAPDIDFSRLPHRSFMISLPSEYLPIEGDEESVRLVLVSAITDAPSVTLIGSKRRITVSPESSDPGERMGEGSKLDDLAEMPRDVLLSIRIASNVIAYVIEHADCVSSKVRSESARSEPRSILVVAPPRNVVVTREFRRRVIDLVSAGTRAQLRSALAHVVRGHWRNQAVGERRSERRLTWVRPHRRGDLAAGVVSKRVEVIR